MHQQIAVLEKGVKALAAEAWSWPSSPYLLSNFISVQVLASTHARIRFLSPPVRPLRDV